jgi:hypothetical protein
MFSPYTDVIVKICVKAVNSNSKFKGTLVLLTRCDLPQNPSPLARIQAYIDRADCLMKRLANTGQTDYAWKTGVWDEVCVALQPPYGDERISDSTRSSLREELSVIKEQLLSEEIVASISERAYMNWVQERRSFEQEERRRRTRLDETHRREEERRRGNNEDR